MLKCRFSESTGENVLSVSIYSSHEPPPMIDIQFWHNDLYFGSLGVIWGQIRFFLHLTFDGMEIECRKWSQSVSLAKTHQLICNMTDLARRNLIWPWPEMKFWYRPFQVNIYMLRRASTRGTKNDFFGILFYFSRRPTIFIKYISDRASVTILKWQVLPLSVRNCS